jgi:pyrimidine-nucleoside phosphorylase
MLAHRVIEKKRDGGRIEPAEWLALTRAYAAGEVPDYQMAALLMACFLRGLDREETAALTEAMLTGGARLDLSELGRPRSDKHSIGGVGDKVSLVLAPIIAVLGVAVPMMSGRSLGHTGGTLDKLESIPGFRTDLSLEDVRRQLERLDCALFGQTTAIAPVDRKLYALRDATATVESIPLIAASIMSKKLAEDLTGLVLDIKCGSGSFMPELARGLELAGVMIALGAAHGCPTVALVTAMDRPLGRACGNALEVEEAIAALHGEGPEDLMEVTYALGVEMLLLAGGYSDAAQARNAMQTAVASGRAAERMAAVIEAQGGDPRVVHDTTLLPRAPECVPFLADRPGVVQRVEPRAIGRGVTALGGGRIKVDDRVDPAVGFVITARPTDRVQQGDQLATILARDSTGVEAGLAALRQAIVIGDEAEPPLPLVSHRVTATGVERLA